MAAVTDVATKAEPFVELDLALSAEAIAWKEKARRFAREVVRPVGIELDLMSPKDVCAKGSPLFDFIKEAHKEGYTKLTGPKELGGLGLSRIEEYLIFEEIATGDAGLGAVLFLAPFPFQYAYNLGNDQMKEEFSRPYFSGQRLDWFGCWAITEPAHGSDWLVAPQKEMVVPGGELRATLKGGDYVLNGRKSLWVSCGQVATHATLFVNIDSSGLDRGGIAIVPLDLPGISRGEPMDKLGLRALPQGQLIFDNVHIPRRNMIVEPDTYKEVLHATHVGANVATALLAFGTGRAAYEGALKWTKERVQGGKVIYDHQATRLRLFRMFTLLESARSMCRAVYKYNYAKLDAQEDGRIEHSCAAKVFTTDAAFEIADTAIQLCGDRGLDRHGVVYKDGTVFPAEKLMRDAKAYKIADGENTLLMLLGATQL